MNSVDINFSEFGPPIKLIIIDPKKYKSRFKSQVQLKSGRTATLPARQPQYSAFEYPSHHQPHQQHKVPNFIPRTPAVQQQNNNNSDKNTDRPVANNVQVQAIAAISDPSSTTTTDVGKSAAKPKSNIVEEAEVTTDEEDTEQSFLTTEQTTRVGRVSKKTKLFNPNANSSPSSSASSSTSAANQEATADGVAPAPPKPKVKKRKPAEAFRCKTCSKYYVGHTKLKLHYKKNPDHKIPAAKSIAPSSATSANETATIPPPPSPSPEIVILKACTSVGVQANLHQQPDDCRDRDSNSAMILLPDSVTHPLTLDIDSNGNCTTPVTRRRMLEPITVPMTSGNVMSPGENSMNAAMTTLTMTVGDEFEFRCGHLQQEQQRHIGTCTSTTDSLMDSLVCHSVTEPNEFDKSREEDKEIEVSIPSPTPSIDTLDRIAPPPKVLSKPIWEFVEEKMIREGINQVLTEISDIAEKLSKIARDKIIPIREEEEERLQALQSSVPIIQVDNPFLSHLLDLPFGTYIFKEDDDEDSRRIKPPPPSITELSQFSLTGGAEVDIDKFLTPESAAAGLPHLTNLDFNAICNGGASNH